MGNSPEPLWHRPAADLLTADLVLSPAQRADAGYWWSGAGKVVAAAWKISRSIKAVPIDQYEAPAVVTRGDFEVATTPAGAPIAIEVDLVGYLPPGNLQAT